MILTDYWAFCQTFKNQLKCFFFFFFIKKLFIICLYKYNLYNKNVSLNTFFKDKFKMEAFRTRLAEQNLYSTLKAVIVQYFINC